MKRKREKRGQVEVLEWLADTHSELHGAAEIDRDWIWLPVDLRDDPETRASIKEFGFRFAKRGHALPSGRVGTWGHACSHPIPFKRGAGGGRVTVKEPTVDLESELLAAAGLV